MKATANTGRTMSDYELDPRPELHADHSLWVALLASAHSRDLDLWGALHCLRCGGAQLVRDKDFGMLIRPGEWDKTEYEVFRSKHLAPRKAEVVEALRLAAQRLPQLQKDTLRSRVVARVKAIEAKALALGWTRDEIWSEKEWDDPVDGRRRSSLLKALLSGSQTWGNVEVGEVTTESIEFLVPGPGLNTSDVTSLHLYKVSTAAKLLGELTELQVSAHPKKEAV